LRVLSDALANFAAPEAEQSVHLLCVFFFRRSFGGNATTIALDVSTTYPVLAALWALSPRSTVMHGHAVK